MSNLWDDKEILEREQNIEGLRHAHALLSTNFPQARTELEGLANNGSVMAMLYLGHAYKTQGTTGYTEAEKWYRMAYAQGSSSALLHLALMNYQAGKTKEAEDLWSDGVSKNDGPSMFWLASLYLASSSNRVKRAEIKALLERANALGQLRAKHRLGIILMVGRYGIISIPRGVFLFLGFLISGFKVAFRDPTSRRLW